MLKTSLKTAKVSIIEYLQYKRFSKRNGKYRIKRDR